MPQVVAILPRDKLRKPNRALMKVMDIMKLLLCHRNSKQIREKNWIATRSGYIGHWFLLLVGHKTDYGKYDYSAKQASASIHSTYDESISVMYQCDMWFVL